MRRIKISQLVEVITSLDRECDLKLFSRDVAVTHPEIIALYSKVCPQRMDINTMKLKAQDGAYHEEGAVKEAALLADVGLICDNCDRFNHDDPETLKVSKRFREFAKTTIRKFVQSTADVKEAKSAGPPHHHAPDHVAVVQPPSPSKGLLVHQPTNP